MGRVVKAGRNACPTERYAVFAVSLLLSRGPKGATRKKSSAETARTAETVDFWRLEVLEARGWKEETRRITDLRFEISKEGRASRAKRNRIKKPREASEGRHLRRDLESDGCVCPRGRL